MYKVIKRDGAIADFNISKIVSAISKAFDAQNKQYNPRIYRFSGAESHRRLSGARSRTA